MKIKKIIACAAAATLSVSALTVSSFAATYEFKSKDTPVYNATVNIGFNGGLNETDGDMVFTITAPEGVTVNTAKVTVNYITTKEDSASFTGTYVAKDGWPLITDNKFNVSVKHSASTQSDMKNVMKWGDFTGTLELSVSSSKKIDKDADKDKFALSLGGAALNADWTPWTGVNSLELGADTSAAGSFKGLNVDANLASKVYNGNSDAKLTIGFDDPKETKIVTLKYKAAGADKDTSVEAVVKSGDTSATFTIPAGAFLIPAQINNGLLTTEKVIKDISVTGVTVKSASLEYGDSAAETTTAEVTTAPATSEVATSAPVVVPGETTAPAATTSTGNKPSGGDNNPDSGFVFAIIPAAIAAAGVVIAKKRK